MDIFDKLRRVFSTGLIVSDVKSDSIKVIDTRRSQAYKHKNNLISKLHRSQAYSSGISQNYAVNRLALYRDYDMMDADPILSCLAGDTRVMTLDKIQTMQQLTERYKDGQEFQVWCWDNQKCKYTIGNAHHPRKMGVKPVIQIYFDNGKMLKCTKDHKILLSDGTYKQAQYLTQLDSLRPFLYQNKEYMMINQANTSKYTKAHQYIYKHILKKHKKGMHIHHLDHNKYNNQTKNLIQLTPETHMQYHGISIKTNNKKKLGWTKEKRQQASIRSINRFKCPQFLQKFSKKMKQVANTPYRKKQYTEIAKELFKDPIYKEKVTAEMIKYAKSDKNKMFQKEKFIKMNQYNWQHNKQYQKKISQTSSNNCKALWKQQGFKQKFVQKRLENLELKIANDPNYNKKIKNISTQKILLQGIKYNNLKQFSQNFDTGIIGYPAKNAYKLISRRLKKCGYKNFTDYKNNYQYQNHKVIKIIDNNQSIEVYDLTVDYYQNFCLQNQIIVSNSALDIYVYEALTKDQFGDILQVKTQDKQIQEILRQLFYDRLNCQFNFSVWFRNFVKYGDFAVALKLSPQYGIIGAEPISPYQFQRVQDDQDNPEGYAFRLTGIGNQIIQNYNIAHFRLLRDTNFLPYGKSVLQPARRVWKSLSLMIDAMMIQRIMRAPERRVFKIQTGDLAPQEIAPYMQDVMNKMQKVPYKDPATGQINLKYNMQNLTQDYYIPVRGSHDGSSIETLSGMDNNMIEDVQFIKSYMMAALKIPKAFLSFEQGIESKSTLAGLDIIFARYIQDLQNLFVNELNRIALIHLFMLGYTDLDEIDFRLSLNNPSDVKKLQEMQLWARKVQLGKQMQQSGHFSFNYIFEHIYQISQKQSVTILKHVLRDAKFRKKLMDIQSGEDQQFGSERGYQDQHDDYVYDDRQQQPQGRQQQKEGQVELSDQTEEMLDNEIDTNPLDNNNFIGGTPLNID